MRRALPTLSILLVLAFSAVAAPAVSSELEKLGKRMTCFYKAPTKEEFENFQKDIVPFQDFFAKRPDTKLLVAVFIARVSKKYGYPITDTPFAEMARKILDPKSDLAKLSDDDSKISPTKLDVWWTSFFATADTKYLEKIFQFVGRDMDNDRNVRNLLVDGAANWSFKSNCRQHEKIMAFAKAKLEKGSLPPSKIKFLKQCVARQSENKGDSKPPKTTTTH
jgi:hypothetical protein